MDDYFLGPQNKSVLPSNAPAFLYFDCKISSEDQGPECQDVIYSFPTNLSPASLVIGLRGAFISFVKLSKDTESFRCKKIISKGIEARNENCEEINGFYFLKYTSLSDETLRAGATLDSNENLVVLIVPTLLFHGSNHHLREILIELIDYIQFFYVDLVSAALYNYKELTKFFSLFFYNYGEWIDFLKPPENVSITCSHHMSMDKVLTSLESSSSSFHNTTKNVQINCRTTQIHGCALFDGRKVLVNHFALPCLRKMYQYLMLNHCKQSQNDIKLSVHWLTVNLFCNSSEKNCSGHHAILLLQRSGLSLAILLYSYEKIIEPPFDCLNMGKLCLDEALELNRTINSNSNFQLARPENFFESSKSNSKEKEEYGKYFQWFKTQMSPKSIRKVSQFGSSSSLNNIEDTTPSIPENNCSNEKQPVLTDNGNYLFSYSYTDSSRSSSQLLSDSTTKSEPMYENVIKLLDRMFLKFSKMNSWKGNFSVIESNLTFSCKIQTKSSNDSSKTKAQEFRFTISSHREKKGSALLISYNSNVPPNLKTLLSRVYRKVHFYDTS